MTTSSQSHDTASCRGLYMALELSSTTWKLAFCDQVGRRARIRNVAVGNFDRLQQEIAKAKKVLGLDPDAPVFSCYEAGRDGFWVHRLLVLLGIENLILDAASIQVNRKQRRVKTDRVDAEMLVMALMRFRGGDRFACRPIRIPDAEVEDARQLNRELRTLKTECTAHSNRIRCLLVSQGVLDVALDRKFPDWVKQAKTGDGQPLGSQMTARLEREFERLTLATEQIRQLEMQQVQLLRIAAREALLPETERTSHRIPRIAYDLMQLGGIGPVTSWTLSTEVFSWRDIQNRRQLGALAGLTPTPHTSGSEEREQGISKSGRGELRILMIEVAWGWLRLQPQSALAKWYRRRFGDSTKRNRKRGIVALARKLLVALGKFVQQGEIPEGAQLRKQWNVSYRPSLSPRTHKVQAA